MSDFQIIKYKHGKNSFEVLVKPNTVLQYRDGKIGFENVLAVEDVFTNHGKGEKPNTSDLQSAFGTTNVKAILKKIVDDGEYHLTTAERKEKVDKKKREILTFIHKYYTDPRSKTPHPLTRLEGAFDQIKYNVDPFVPVEKQVLEVVKLIININLPLKKSEIAAELRVKHQYLGQVMSVVKKWCQVQSDNYSATGATFRITMVPGDYDQFNKEMDQITKGDYEFNIDGAQVQAEQAAKGWQAKKKEEKDAKTPKKKK